MSMSTLRVCAIAVLAFAAGSLLTKQWMRIQEVRADSNRVFELRIYQTLPGRLPALQSNFRDHHVALFKKHGITSVGYWTPLDSPASDNTLIFVLAHDSREAATQHWKEFGDDPEFQEVARKSQGPDKIIDKVDVKFMTPTDYSPLK
jgi:hypothetical protein